MHSDLVYKHIKEITVQFINVRVFYYYFGKIHGIFFSFSVCDK